MNVICDTCKLTLTVRDQDRGRTHTCPVCRGVLREESVKPPPTETPITWPGHDLSEAIALVNGAALSVILDVESPQGWGEIQLIAGGIHKSTCVHNDKTIAGEDAVTLMSSWRPDIHIRSRLPSPAGELDVPGPDTGDLAERPLAAVMRYCEDFVLTCAVVAWRGNETAHVYYRRGAIERTLVNGVDDAARLPDVMAWKAGRYRILLPKLELPEAAPEAAAPEPSPMTTIPGMTTVPGMETPAGITQPQLVAEPPKPEPAAAFSPAKLPHRPAMTIIGMPAVIVPPPGAPAAAPPAASKPAADAGTTLPMVTQERPVVEAKRSMPIEIMDAPVAPRPSSPAIPAAPQPGAPEPVSGRTSQRGVVKMAEEPKAAPASKPVVAAPARPAPAAAPPPAKAAPAPAAPPAARLTPAPAPAPAPTPAPAPAAAAVAPPVAAPPVAAPVVAAPATRAAPPPPVARPEPAVRPAPEPAPELRQVEERATATRRGEPPAPKKRPWLIPLFIVAFVTVATAAFFIARVIWPAGPTTP